MGSSSVQDLLEKIRNNKDLNCFIETYDDEAIKAEQLISNKSQSECGPLRGLTFGVKDLFNDLNHEVNASSHILKGYKSIYHSTVVKRIRENDGLILGRQNCDEFGMGSTNENSCHGPVLNPLNKDFVAGGSSGGSAAAVAAGLCNISIGTDTGGSVRLPAAHCGVIGFKPTYGLIPRYGVIAYASSFDTVGIVADSIENIARTTQVVQGPDSLDNTAIKSPGSLNNLIDLGSKKYRIAHFKGITNQKGVEESIHQDFSKSIKWLKSQGHDLVGIEFKELDYLLPTYYILTMAEASSNLSRYDGIRFGYQLNKKDDLQEFYLNNRTVGFGDEVKRRIMLGNLILSSGYSDAFFTKAQQIRRLLIQKIEQVFKEFDFIIMPTSAGIPPKVGELTKDPLKMYMGDIFTVLPSLTGIPALSLPTDNIRDSFKGSLQIIGSARSELELLSFSRYILETIK